MLLKTLRGGAMPSLPAVPPLLSRVGELQDGLMPLLKRYVPLSVALKLQDGVKGGLDLSEMRQVRGPYKPLLSSSRQRFPSPGLTRHCLQQVSVLFINLQGLILAADQSGCSEEAHRVGQQAMLKVQSAVHGMEGQARLCCLWCDLGKANSLSHAPPPTCRR